MYRLILRTTILILLSLFAASVSDVASYAAEPLNRTPSPGEYQSPEQTIASMKLPDGFRVQVFAAEPDVVQPIAYAIDPRGRLWVIENYSYPDWNVEGRDRVVIFEDADGDGRFDKRDVFWEGGNFATGIEVGFGGVWIGSPPNLLFIPDRDGDDKPDGEPVVLLDGWGHDDTHETLNSFNWGPDGWLYGCQGVFTHSLVGKPGTPEAERTPLNACIWRYHPTRHEFEVFAEGGSNQWGIDFNDHGQAFMTACVIPHLYHVVQGGRYTRQAGQHNNPYTYEDIQTIRTHEHFAAAFAGAMIYLGDNFPDDYRNQVFFNNIHANKIHADWLQRKGSGYTAKFGPHDRPPEGDDRGTGFMNSGDKWYRGLCLRTGPDGGVFVCDWYDRLPCHQIPPKDQTNGRIYKITHGAPQPAGNVDVAAMADDALVGLLLHKNDWWVRTARKVLAERADDGKDLSAARGKLREMAASHDDATRRLRAMWALHTTGGLDEPDALELTSDDNEFVRAWAIQCALDDRQCGQSLHAKLVALAADDPSPVVRLYLASACQRMEAAQAWPIVEALVARAEDADDHNLPLMVWYAAEPLVPQDVRRATALVAKCQIPKVRQFLARRIASL
jgi:putative membrane-bound dehydrogenase-like protein